MIDLLLEKYLGNVVEKWKREKPDTDVFINPDGKELKEILKKRDEMRIILPNNKDFIAFDVFTLHQSVREQMGLPKDSLTLMGYVWGGRDLDVTVTDNIRNTKWDESPETAEFIRNHKYLNRKFKLGDINYYNEAIVGDWEEL